MGGFDWFVDNLGLRAKTRKQDNDFDVCFEIIYALIEIQELLATCPPSLSLSLSLSPPPKQKNKNKEEALDSLKDTR